MLFSSRLVRVNQGLPVDVMFYVAFGAGLLSFLSPCVLPMIPIYLASLYGRDIFEQPERRSRLPIFMHSLSFVIGFSIVFVAMGLLVGLAGLAVGSHLWIQKISGGVMVVFGLFLLLALVIPKINFEQRLAPSRQAGVGYFRSFLTGMVFTLAWTPCVGPVLGGIMALAWASETAWRGGYLLGIYSLGLGLPFLIIGLAFDRIVPWIKRLNRYPFLPQVVSGVLLVTIGILVIIDKLSWLQGI